MIRIQLFTIWVNTFKETSNITIDNTTGYVLFEIDLTQGKIRKQFFSGNKEANNSYRVAEIKGGGQSK